MCILGARGRITHNSGAHSLALPSSLFSWYSPGARISNTLRNVEHVNVFVILVFRQRKQSANTLGVPHTLKEHQQTPHIDPDKVCHRLKAA